MSVDHSHAYHDYSYPYSSYSYPYHERFLASPRLFGPLATLFAARPFRCPLSKSGGISRRPTLLFCLQCVARAARDGIRNERATKTCTRPPKACEGSGMACARLRPRPRVRPRTAHTGCATRVVQMLPPHLLAFGAAAAGCILVWCMSHVLHVRMLHCGCCVLRTRHFITGGPTACAPRDKGAGAQEQARLGVSGCSRRGYAGVDRSARPVATEWGDIATD